jgi:preprotein translocase subunit YajC
MKKQHQQLIIISLLVGTGYYFLVYLPDKRNKAKEEIMKTLQQNSININELNANL